MSVLMRGWAMTGYGGPEKSGMREMVRPVQGDGEVLVKVHAAGLNPVDWKTREGKLRAVMDFDMPVVMGNELAGEVIAQGRDATRFALGDRVMVRVPKDRMGAYAEYAAVPEADCALVPASIDDTQAAAIPLAGLTALQVLRDELHLQQGDRVLITGGAGGVGTFAIPLAKWLGAHVTTTASSRGRELVERLGADRVVDYTAEQFEDVIEPVDAAFDMIGGDTLSRCFRIVKSGGKVVSIAGLPEPRTATQDLGRGFPLTALFWVASLKLRMQARMQGVDYRFLLMHPDGEGLVKLASLVDDGTITPVVDKVYPFARMADAMAYLEKGHAKGKVVVTMDADASGE
ncbi:MAG: NADP-dependent oxidoreductase [Alteraurantiacibacter sp.]